MVRYEVQGRQARLTIDREAQRNALNAEVLRGLRDGLDRADADPAVGVIVLTGAGEKAFCAGADLGGAQSGDGGLLEMHEGRRSYGQLLLKLSRTRKPSLALVNGLALAGGLGLVLGCDLAIAAEEVEVGLPEIDRGLFPMQVIALLQRHVGRKRALELVLTGRRLAAREAVEWGILNRAVPRAGLSAAAAELADSLGGKSQAVLALGRRAFFTAEGMAVEPAIDYLAAQLSLNTLLEDAAEGVIAFMQKRKPEWKHK